MVSLYGAIAVTAAVIASTFLPQTVLADANPLKDDKVNKDAKVESDKNNETPHDCHEQNESCIAADDCAVWFAPSTIPGAGMGMFAGRSFESGENMLPKGEIVIPIVDIAYHHNTEALDYQFLWDEYTWNAAALLMDREGMEVNSASPGFGAAANCYLDLINVEEYNPTQIGGSTGLHRSKHAGAGAFTYYHNRRAAAKTPIKAGNELFVSYGNSWFETREYYMGQIPLKGHLNLASKILLGYTTLVHKYNETFPLMMEKLRDQFFIDKPTNESHILNAIPNTRHEFQEATRIGLKQLRRQQSTVSIEYLQEHGTCASNLVVGVSTIPQAGRGAFATRSFQKGSVVAPVPLIHLVDGKRNMEMYELTKVAGKDDDYKPKNRTNVVGHQLLLNYCFGHANSTLLLSPYGIATSLVNHDPDRANVKLQWADPKRSNHQPEWLNKSLEQLRTKDSAVLAWEFVATRDIMADEEILMDYGKEWQDAWNQHVKEWKPNDGASLYRAAHEFKSDVNGTIRTEFEQLHDPYPENVQLLCHSLFKAKVWKRVRDQGKSLEEFIENSEHDNVVTCDVLRREQAQDDNEIQYTVLYRDPDNEKRKPTKVEGIPRIAFYFADKQSTADMHLKNAFRHEIMIPDELFPEQWKDKNENLGKS